MPPVSLAAVSSPLPLVLRPDTSPLAVLLIICAVPGALATFFTVTGLCYGLGYYWFLGAKIAWLNELSTQTLPALVLVSDGSAHDDLPKEIAKYVLFPAQSAPVFTVEGVSYLQHLPDLSSGLSSSGNLPVFAQLCLGHGLE